MKKVYYLGTCSTCKRILTDLDALLGDFTRQDIKSDPLTPKDLDLMYSFTGSYEKLFSRKAMKFRSMGRAQKNLQEDDYRRLLLEEYTFLKRPVFIVDQQIFIGNSTKTQADLESHLRTV